jgi:hypothetical protein
MNWPAKNDIRRLEKLPKRDLLRLLFLNIKNIWRVDGLYFLGIEEAFSTEAATEIDAKCWEIMGKIEARELKDTLVLKGTGIKDLLQALQNTSWALYQTGKELEASDQRGVFRVTRCRTQETRIQKGLRDFPCKRVRSGYLETFAQEFNPNIHVTCRTCPPDIHSKHLWCEWEFTLKE